MKSPYKVNSQLGGGKNVGSTGLDGFSQITFLRLVKKFVSNKGNLPMSRILIILLLN